MERSNRSFPSYHIRRIDRLRRLLKSKTPAAEIRREFHIPRYTPPADVSRETSPAPDARSPKPV